MTFDEAVAYLNTAAARGMKLGLSRMNELMHRLGDPQEQIPMIHIAGTNGKGSVGAMLSAILTSAGFRTGHFSSPALTTLCDCIRINTREATPAQFAAAVTEAARHAEAMDDPPTEFEILTAAAYTLFFREGCTAAVIECCMGGDSDCTNCITAPLLSIITNVQLDHQRFLGNTIAEIARHKAGILKSGCAALLHDTSTPAEGIAAVRAHAQRIGARLHLLSEMPPVLDRSSVCMTIEGLFFRTQGASMHLPLLGSYQLENVQTVLASVEILRRQGIFLPVQAVREGLANTVWHGRFEVLCRDPYVIFDGAHNPAGILQVHRSLEQYFGEDKAVLLIGVMADKDHSSYAKYLAPHIESAFTVTPEHPRALDARILAEDLCAGGIAASACESVEQGVRAAASRAGELGMPLVALGSLYLYREFCEMLARVPALASWR